MARDHARWNMTLGVPCEFILLNCIARSGGQPSIEGVDFVSFNDSKHDMQDLERLLRENPPRGVTPLADRVAEIHQRIAAQAQELASRGQMVFLTIATDGLPTAANFGGSNPADRDRLVLELRRLATRLPVQLVIRLCSDEDNVVKFYDEIDEEMELPMDVLDDLSGEAKQIAEKGNGWFVYSPLLHRVREAGTLCKLLDDLDERSFGQVEARRFVQLMSPVPLSAAEFHSADPKEFIASVSRIASSAAPMFDPISGQPKPFVDSKKLSKLLRVGGGGLACFAWCQ